MRQKKKKKKKKITGLEMQLGGTARALQIGFHPQH
jgi:hypothetical protein